MNRDRITEPHPSRLRPDHPQRAEILAAHRAAIEAGRRTYVDPASGFQVFTAAELLAQGACCASGCRHCPYRDTPPSEESS